MGCRDFFHKVEYLRDLCEVMYTFIYVQMLFLKRMYKFEFKRYEILTVGSTRYTLGADNEWGPLRLVFSK